MTTDAVDHYLQAGEWQRLFDEITLAKGGKRARGRQVKEIKAAFLDTGDLEITAVLPPDLPDDPPRQVSLALWSENDHLQLDADCTCGRGLPCEHAAALCYTLAKGKPGQRLDQALGGTPHADTMSRGNHLTLAATPAAPARGTLRFHLRIERRTEGRDAHWLPEIHATAEARYQNHPVPLDPSGKLPPLVLPEGKIHRDRAAEMEAVRTLYALDLFPLSDVPPGTPSGRFWAPDRQSWPHPSFYWQRFRHEAVPALESRGWEVRFAPPVGHQPLVFRTQSWRAEIIPEGRGWFTLSAGFEIDGENFDLQPILAALVANRFLEVTEGLPAGQEFLIFLPDGRGLALPVGRFRKILITLGELTAFPLGSQPIRLAAADAARLSEDTSLEPELPPELTALGRQWSAHFQSATSASDPSGLRADLRHYQREGFQWMQGLARGGLNGILADDMGLGKTLQTLTHLLKEVEEGRTEGRPSLVIAPTSVVENWQREAARFTPDLRVLVLQGPSRRRRFASLARCHLVLSSYALLPRDLQRFLDFEFHLFILDEAQHIKNPAAQVTQAVRQVRARHRLCLSGTPVENHLGELWSLMNFLNPGWLGTQQTFTETYRTPIERQGNQGKREALSRRVGPLILRRTKHDVAKELPPKTELLHTIILTQEQKDLYETVRSAMDKHVRQALELQGQQSQIVFLDALLKLRQVCCHPALLDHPSARGRHLTSAKFDYLIDLLETLFEEGHRVLLFSQFTSMLALIERHLQAIECPYLKLTGDTKDRQGLVDRFQKGEGRLFLISLKAGGTGLNLTGADAVIHYDPWWNPAAENQATDRAYRIGQDKPVFVHKLICQDTVEARIQDMQKRKHLLASELFAGAGAHARLTPETLDYLFSPIAPPAKRSGSARDSAP